MKGGQNIRPFAMTISHKIIKKTGKPIIYQEFNKNFPSTSAPPQETHRPYTLLYSKYNTILFYKYI